MIPKEISRISIPNPKYMTSLAKGMVAFGTKIQMICHTAKKTRENTTLCLTNLTATLISICYYTLPSGA
jgi:hypothetical protein